MKRIAYSFLLVALLSCGTKSELQENRIRVEFRDSTSREYNLLAVRENALVVSAIYYRDSSPQVIHFANIHHIFHAIDGKAKGAALGGLIGCAATLGATLIVAGHNKDNVAGVVFIGVLGSVGAALAGILIGSAVTDDDRQYDLSKPRDVSWLKDFARYPDTEPPELQKIK